MSEPKKLRSGWAVWVAVLPILYVLSFGPALGLCDRAIHAGEDARTVLPPLRVFYFPLIETAKRVPAVESLGNDYASLFRPPRRQCAHIKERLTAP